MGRHAIIRTPENADRICELIAEGFTLRQIAREIGFQSASAIMNWARDDEAFRERYARAKELQIERMEEEILEISDDGSNDWMEREQDGKSVVVLNSEHIQRSRLRVDSRKWLMAKMMPKKYGDRVAVAGDADAPLLIEVAVEERQQAAKAMLDKAFGESGDG